jgi:hypothetical protein
MFGITEQSRSDHSDARHAASGQVGDMEVAMKKLSLALLALSACAEPVGAVIAEGAPAPEADAADLEEARVSRATPWLVVSDVSLEDADGDWTWEAGEAATIKARLVNVRSRDFLWYPGITVTTDDPRVEVGQGWLYAIFGRTSHEIEMTVSASGLKAGDVVTFTLQSDALGCDSGFGPCPLADTTTLTVQVE